MTSSPYQSNLLRFFVRQYRQGMDRHRLAVRKTRSSIALGSELGVVIAITPTYALLRSAQNIGKKAGQALEKAAEKLKLPAAGFKTSDLTELLDLSGFVSLPAIQGHGEKVDEDQVVKGISTLDLGLADLTDNPAWVDSEVMMAEVLITAGESLRTKQRRQLAGQLSWWQSLTAKARHLVERLVAEKLVPEKLVLDKLVVRSPNSSCLSAEPITSEPITSEKLSFNQASAKELLSTQPQKITGLASDIATKSLVLVLGNVTIWNGLSTGQQKRIQEKIDAVLSVSSVFPQVAAAECSLSAPDRRPESGLDTESGLDRRPESWLGVSQAKTAQIITKTSQALAVVSHDLIRPVYSFWVAVLQVMSEWFQPGADSWRPKSLTSGYLPLPAPSSLLQRATDNLLDPQSLTPVYAKYALTSAPTSAARMSAIQCSAPSRMTRRSSYLDATVISVDYIEHPLEKLLKWVDRFLVWFENGWQRLLDWLQQKKR